MPSMIMELTVEMDDGSTYQVIADQRDIARWEVQPFGWPVSKAEDQMSMRFLRFLAWSAAFRQQLTTLGWEAFDARLVEAAPLDDEDDEEGKGKVPADAEDPGQSAPSATPSSRSRGRAAKR